MIHEIPLSTEEEIAFVKKGFVNVVLGIHCEQLKDKGFRRIDLELQIIKENGLTTYRDLSLMVPRYQNLTRVNDSVNKIISRNRSGIKNLPRQTNKDCDEYAKELEF